MKSIINIITLFALSSALLIVSCNENTCECEKEVIKKTLTLNSPESIIDMPLTSRYPDILATDTAYGVSLYYWTFGGITHESKICMRFDLSSISQTARIKKAIITSTEVSTAFNASDATNLYKITEDWDPAVTNWNNPPTYIKTNPIYDAKDPDDSNLKVEFDVTQFVQYWVNNPSKNYGFIIELADQAIYHGYNFYASNEDDPNKRLKVVIEYEE